MRNRTSSLAAPGAGHATTLAATAPASAITPASAGIPVSGSDTLAISRVTSWRMDAIGCITILILTGLVSWHRLWLQNGLAHLDIPTFYLPWYAFMGDHLRHLDLPGWNPHVFSGTAFAGDPQSGWMYFPAMIFFTFLDAVRAYEVLLIFHLALAGLATYAFARVIGLGVIASLVAAFAYEFGPFVNHISCCLIHVQLAAWIPVALLGIELLFRASTWSARAAAWVLVGFAVSQMMSGWVGQGAYNGLLVVGSYMAYRCIFTSIMGAITHRERIARLIVDGAGVLIFAFGLAAAGLLPRLDVVERTNLAGGEYEGFETDKYAGGWRVITFFDRMLSDDNGFRSLVFYLGAPTIALLVIAPFLAGRRYRVPYFLVMTTLVSILTLKQTPVHDLFFLLPRFEVLHSHVPSRILAVQWIGPAMLAGAAAEALLREPNRRRIRQAAVFGVGMWALGVFTLIALTRGISWTTIAFAFVTCGVVAAFALPGVWAKRGVSGVTAPHALLGIALVILVVADPAGRGLVDTLLTDQQNELLALPSGPVDRDAVPINASRTDEGGAGEFLQTKQAEGENVRYIGYDYTLKEAGNGYPSTYREYYWLTEAQDILVNARAMPLRIEDAQGYNPMQLSRYINAILFANHQEQNYHDSQFMPEGLESPILDMLSVKYIIIPNKIPPGRPRPEISTLIATHREVFRNDTIRVLENPHALAKAWTVHDVQVASANFGLLMIDQGFADPRVTAFIEPGNERPFMAAPAVGQADVVKITHDGADQMRIDVDMAAPGMLVVSETYDPGWNAYVDGKRTDLYAVNGVLKGISVPAGHHKIELVYEPASLHWGIVTSWIFIGLSLLILVVWGISAVRSTGGRRTRAANSAASPAPA